MLRISQPVYRETVGQLPDPQEAIDEMFDVFWPEINAFVAAIAGALLVVLMVKAMLSRM